MWIVYRLDFPFEDINAIGAALIDSGVLVPGYIPPAVGMLSVEALDLAHLHERQTTVLLPDRNLVSEIARISRRGGLDLAKPAAKVAAQLMAFCQSMDIEIEPSIAYHELAHKEGNAAAHEELGWFQAADNSQARAWIDLALGRSDTLTTIDPPVVPRQDLQAPLRTWRRNYIVALKIAALELGPGQPIDRALGLLDWMFDHFILAGPGAVFATMYFSPRAPRRGMMKGIRSPDRTRAIAGARNAAWDMTVLSDFLRNIAEGDPVGRRFILATGDRALAAVAPLLLLDAIPNQDQISLEQGLQTWWAPSEAKAISSRLFDIASRIERGERAERVPGDGDVVGQLIEAGEQGLREWSADRE